MRPDYGHDRSMPAVCPDLLPPHRRAHLGLQGQLKLILRQTIILQLDCYSATSRRCTREVGGCERRLDLPGEWQCMRYRPTLCVSAAARYVFCPPGTRSWLPFILRSIWPLGWLVYTRAEDSGRAVCTVLPDCLLSTSPPRLAVLRYYSLCLQMICRAYYLTSLCLTTSEPCSSSVFSPGYSRTPCSNLCIVSIIGRPSQWLSAS